MNCALMCNITRMDSIEKEVIIMWKKTLAFTAALGLLFQTMPYCPATAAEIRYEAENASLTGSLESISEGSASGGKVVGNAKAEPHIEPVKHWVQSELPKRFAQKLSK